MKDDLELIDGFDQKRSKRINLTKVDSEFGISKPKSKKSKNKQARDHLAREDPENMEI